MNVFVVGHFKLFGAYASKLDENFQTAMGKVERSMVSMLPTLQAFFPVRSYAFHDGVFELIKDKALEADKPVSSFMLGK